MKRATLRMLPLLTLALLLGFGITHGLSGLALAGKDAAPGTADGIFPPDPGRGIARMARELNLSTEQKRQVAQLLKDNKPQAQALREQMKSARQTMGEVMTRSPGDEAAVRKAARGLAQAGEELAVRFGKIKAQIDQVLTAEQKAQLARKKDEFLGKAARRMEERSKALDAWIDENLKG